MIIQNISRPTEPEPLMTKGHRRFTRNTAAVYNISLKQSSNNHPNLTDIIRNPYVKDGKNSNFHLSFKCLFFS